MKKASSRDIAIQILADILKHPTIGKMYAERVTKYVTPQQGHERRLKVDRQFRDLVPEVIERAQHTTMRKSDRREARRLAKEARKMGPHPDAPTLPPPPVPRPEHRPAAFIRRDGEKIKKLNPTKAEQILNNGSYR